MFLCWYLPAKHFDTQDPSGLISALIPYTFHPLYFLYHTDLYSMLHLPKILLPHSSSFTSGCCRNISFALTLFTILTISPTEYFGWILTNICTCLTAISISSISQSLALNISRNNPLLLFVYRYAIPIFYTLEPKIISCNVNCMTQSPFSCTNSYWSTCSSSCLH